MNAKDKKADRAARNRKSNAAKKERNEEESRLAEVEMIIEWRVHLFACCFYRNRELLENLLRAEGASESGIKSALAALDVVADWSRRELLHYRNSLFGERGVKQALAEVNQLIEWLGPEENPTLAKAA